MGRNDYLNPAFKPRSVPVDDPDSAAQSSMNVMGDTRFDPFMGTPWGRFFDQLNGARIGSAPGLPNSQTLGESARDTQSSSAAAGGGPFGAFGVGTGGNIPTGNGSQTEGPYGALKPADRLKSAVRGIR